MGAKSPGMHVAPPCMVCQYQRPNSCPDAAHVGHARNYVSFDILRRIMEDYFGYQVTQVMNITDIDDKIIMRAAERGISIRELSAQYEQEFWNDMEALGVRPPSAITRVSEYIPEVLRFIARIVENGFAYESGGSVYFDTAAFDKSPNHRYNKLMPEQAGNTALLAEGEGALTSGFASEKKNPSDFALWKKSKEGEPNWKSPWGEGRPGWHIECSTMASDVLGPEIDIHSGGTDLRFPHHENEMAQSEAHFDNDGWVKYFIHSGHLHIEGLKMSKSLKNFISIGSILKRYPARQLRFLFLMHKYDQRMNYEESFMSQVQVMERAFVEFFHNVRAVIRETPIDAAINWRQSDKELHDLLLVRQKEVHAALCDNFNTPLVLQTLLDLIKATNTYMTAAEPRVAVLRNIADYVTSIFRSFGLINVHGSFGFTTASTEGGGGGDAYVEALSTFRDAVRAAARERDAKAILQLSDALRDDVLPPLGVRLEDRSSGKAVWKMDDRETLMRERQVKIEAEQKKLALVQERKAKEAARIAEKLERGAVDPLTMFKTGEYSQWDDKGIPTHANDAPLEKSVIKKLRKTHDAQVKLHAWYLEQQK